MTYQTLSAPFTVATFARDILGHIRSFFKSIGHAMMANSTGQQRLDYFHALQAKSDIELADLKIKRKDILHEAFNGVYHI